VLLNERLAQAAGTDIKRCRQASIQGIHANRLYQRLGLEII
jgi:hypothetical protein